MKKLLMIVSIILFLTSFNNVKSEVYTPSKTFKIVLTHMGSQKLIKDAYFYVGDEKIWTIDFRNGDKLRYNIKGRVGKNPLCGITSIDNFGDSCAICITKTNDKNLEVELRYSKGVVTYKGYASS